MTKDREYLIDHARVWSAAELPASSIWISEEVSLTDFIARHAPDRFGPADGIEAATAAALRF
jgi:hypothetical protein